MTTSDRNRNRNFFILNIASKTKTTTTYETEHSLAARHSDLSGTMIHDTISFSKSDLDKHNQI
jgi:hypothetical protein